MNITFVYPDYFETQDIHSEPQGRVYLGIGYLSAFLKSGGHRTELVHLIKPIMRSDLIEAISASEPDLVALSATTLQFPKVREIASWVKKDLFLPTVCGGVHPTITPEEVITEPAIDYMCVGEGEHALLELCNALEGGRPVEDIEGMWGKSNGRVFTNPVRPLIADLDALPFPDRSIFDAKNFARNQRNRLTMMASRGCPFDCSYCCNHLLKSVYPNSERYVRFRSPSNVVAEIEAARADDPGIEQIRFDDDILTLHRGWLRRFAPLYKERVGLPFICNARADLLSEEMVELLAGAGCSAITMGIESGNSWLRRNVLERSMDDEKILRAFALCRDKGIPAVSLNMIGFPHETVSMALDTVKMNARVKPRLAQVTALCPFPNTRIFEVCKEGGMLGGASLDTIFSGRSDLKLDKMSSEQVSMLCENFVLLMSWYRKLERLPGALERLAEKMLDWFLETRMVPAKLRDRVLKKGRYRLDWEYFIGVDY